MRTWGIAAAAVALLTLTACGPGGDAATADPSASPSSTAVDESPYFVPTEEADEGLGADLEGVSALVAGEPYPLGPDQVGGQGEVTLESIRPVAPLGEKKPAEGRAFVRLEWTVRNTGSTVLTLDHQEPTVVEPDGRTSTDIVDPTQNEIDDTDYGRAGDFSARMPSSVDPGRYSQGWAVFDVPKVEGRLMLPVYSDDDNYGGDLFEVPVELPFG